MQISPYSEGRSRKCCFEWVFILFANSGRLLNALTVPSCECKCHMSYFWVILKVSIWFLQENIFLDNCKIFIECAYFGVSYRHKFQLFAVKSNCKNEWIEFVTLKVRWTKIDSNYQNLLYLIEWKQLNVSIQQVNWVERDKYWRHQQCYFRTNNCWIVLWGATVTYGLTMISM